MIKKIGIFAGTFDPVHDGHIAVAEEAVKHLGLDELYFLVEKNPWTNKSPIDVTHRRKMVDLAIENNATLLQKVINTDRFTLEKTLPELEKEFYDAELYFVFGADIFLNMNKETWLNLDKLLRHYLVIFERSNIDDSLITYHAKELGIVVAILSSMYKMHSSTDVRLSRNKRNIWMPKKVASYIVENKLYDLKD